MRKARPKLDRVLCGAALVAIAAAIPSSNAGAGTTFGGYDAAASASAVTVFPYAPGQVVERPVEATVSLALATVSTGGQSMGRASTLYPGSPLANLNAILQLLNPDFPPTPPYPLLVESREFEGEKKSDKPGATMATDASPDSSAATADLAPFGAPGAVDIGSARSVSEASMAGDHVESTSRSMVNEVVIGDGAIRIDSVISTATATSDSRTGTCEGDAEVVGLEIGGVPATIGDGGVEAAGTPVFPGIDANERIAEVLDATGLRLRLLGGVGECSGPDASRSMGGLLVEIPLPQAGAVTASANVILASASASASAVPATTFEGFVPPPPPPPATPTTIAAPTATAPPATTGVSGTGDVASVPTDSGTEPAVSVSDPEPAPAPEPSAGGGGSESAQVQPASNEDDLDYRFGGVPASLVVGLLLLAVPASRYLSRYVHKLSTLGVS